MFFVCFVLLLLVLGIFDATCGQKVGFCLVKGCLKNDSLTVNLGVNEIVCVLSTMFHLILI